MNRTSIDYIPSPISPLLLFRRSHVLIGALLATLLSSPAPVQAESAGAPVDSAAASAADGMGMRADSLRMVAPPRPPPVAEELPSEQEDAGTEYIFGVRVRDGWYQGFAGFGVSRSARSASLGILGIGMSSDIGNSSAALSRTRTSSNGIEARVVWRYQAQLLPRLSAYSEIGMSSRWESRDSTFDVGSIDSWDRTTEHDIFQQSKSTTSINGVFAVGMRIGLTSSLGITAGAEVGPSWTFGSSNNTRIRPHYIPVEAHNRITEFSLTHPAWSVGIEWNLAVAKPDPKQRQMSVSERQRMRRGL